jgi:predicted hotdog family 3-hydroxylacyl-ACP dehydratase
MTTYPAISELVPHELPMLALDELLEWDPGFAKARLVVSEESLFVEDGKIDTVLTIEYMAQVVATCLGMGARMGGGAVRMGMVIACRKVNIERPFLNVGEELIVEATRVHGSDHSSSFRAETRDAHGQLVADATMMLIHGESLPE